MSESNSTSTGRQRKKSKKMRDSEEFEAMDSIAGTAAAGGSCVGSAPPIFNSDGTVVVPNYTSSGGGGSAAKQPKRQSRPNKNEPIMDLTVTTMHMLPPGAGPVLGSSSSHKQFRSGVSSGRLKGSSKRSTNANADEQEQQDDDAADVVMTEEVRQSTKKAQQESIQQQQAFAKAQSQAFFDTLPVTEAREMIQASAMSQHNISPSVIHRSVNSKTNTASPLEAAAATVALFPVALQQKYYQQRQHHLQHSNNNNNNTNTTKQHGKLPVQFTRNKPNHPQQGLHHPHVTAGPMIPHPLPPQVDSTSTSSMTGSKMPPSHAALSGTAAAAGGGIFAGTTASTGPLSVPPTGLTALESLNFGNKNDKGTSIGNLSRSSKKRRGSNTSATVGNNVSQQQQQQRRSKPKTEVLDEDPMRFVNPLLTLPPPVVNSQHRANIGGASPSSSSALEGVSAPATLMQGTELQSILSVIFSRPNTYPIAQYATMLGFDVPDITIATDEEMFIPPNTTDIPFGFSSEEDAVHVIPEKGVFASTIWETVYRPKEDGRIDDDAVLEGEIDPLYQTFLAESDLWTTPLVNNPTGNSPFRNLVYNQSSRLKSRIPSPRKIQAVLAKAEEFGILKQSEWSVGHVMKSSTMVTAVPDTTIGAGAAPGDATGASATATAQTNGDASKDDENDENSTTEKTNAADISTAAAESTEAAVPVPDFSVLEVLPSQPPSSVPASIEQPVAEEPRKPRGLADLPLKGGPAPRRGGITALARLDAAKATGSAEPISNLITRQMLSSNKDNLWGFAAWHKGVKKDEPNMSMMLHYQFQWYRLMSVSAKGQNVSELVMRIPYGPVPAVMGEEEISVPPIKDKDHYADEFAAKSERDSLSQRQRLIIILYSLVFEHARMCDVWYCLLQVPQSLVSLLQKYFRLTSVPTKERSNDDAAQHGNTGKNSELVPMLCDLQKWSMKYALLLQKEALSGPLQSIDSEIKNCSSATASLKQRLFVQLPTAREVESTMVRSSDYVSPAPLSGGMGMSAGSTTLASCNVPFYQDVVRNAFVGGKSRFCSAANQQAVVEMQVTVDSKTDVVASVAQVDNAAARVSESAPEDGGKVATDRAGAAVGLSFQIKQVQLDRDANTLNSATPAQTLFSRPVSWLVLKCYPVGTTPPMKLLPNRAVVSTPPGPGPLQCQPVDEVLDALQLKQKELIEMERETLEPKMRSLMEKVIRERREYEKSDFGTQETHEKATLDAHEKMIARRKEFDEAWQKQLEEDMDAVCEICNDGEVTPGNQILFCEACDVAIHQLCYGIDTVPAGDYYCLACRLYGRQKVNSAVERQMRYQAAAAAAAAGETNLAAIVQHRASSQAAPVCCELCPVRNGAYVPVDDSSLRRDGPAIPDPKKPEASKWVHMVCAKWQGLDFVQEAKPTLLIEDVSDLKLGYRLRGYKCCLCLSERGAMNICRHEGCKNWLHVLCARMSGLCEVVHGENALGNIVENPWTLLCPDHSDVPFPNPAVAKRVHTPVHKLVLMAQSFPPEKDLDPRVIYASQRPDKPFNKLTGEERKRAFANTSYEQEVILEVSKRLFGVRCEVCDQCEPDGKNLTRCYCCGVVFCDSCCVEGDKVDHTKRTKYKCAKCTYLAEQNKLSREGKISEVVVDVQCALCCQKGGWLRRGNAEPVSKKVWNGKAKLLAKSLFGQDLWVHCLCAMWCAAPKLTIDPAIGVVDLSQVVLSNGNGFIKSKDVCYLCGNAKGLKDPCAQEGCCYGPDGAAPCFHPTCARQAGLEVRDSASMATLFYQKCYKHGGNEFNLRARLEDLIELEVKRAGKELRNQDLSMTFSDAARLHNASILVMRILGWAWRWTEWWVEHDSNWEPLLEPGQVEENMTKEELKVVESTRESRREDARRCRLAAFGAALRNRAYDVDDDGYNGGVDSESLERALRAILHTKSLVGPLKKIEIEFYVEWLGRAYRSRSRLLGFGEDKIAVGGADFCLHQQDSKPKYELGDRPIPGKQKLPDKTVFEDLVTEVDDFDAYIEATAKAVAEQQAKAKAEAPKKSAKAKKQAKQARPSRQPKSKEGTSSSSVDSVEIAPFPRVSLSGSRMCSVPNCPKQSQGRKHAELCRNHYKELEESRISFQDWISAQDGESALAATTATKRGKRSLSQVEPDSDHGPDFEPEYEVEQRPKKKQRRNRLAVTSTQHATTTSDDAPPPNSSGVILLTKRNRVKPDVYDGISTDDTPKEVVNGARTSRTPGPNDKSKRSTPGANDKPTQIDPELDIPIAEFVRQKKKRRSGEGQPRNNGKFAPKPIVEEATAERTTVKNGSTSTVVTSDSSGEKTKGVAASGAVANGIDQKNTSAGAKGTACDDNDDEQEEEFVYVDCLEDRMDSAEEYSAYADTAREVGRMKGKWEAADDYFRIPRSFRGRII